MPVARSLHQLRPEVVVLCRGADPDDDGQSGPVHSGLFERAAALAISAALAALAALAISPEAAEPSGSAAEVSASVASAEVYASAVSAAEVSAFAVSAGPTTAAAAPADLERSVAGCSQGWSSPAASYVQTR